LKIRRRSTGGDTSGDEPRRPHASVTGPAVAGRVAQLIGPLRENPDVSAVLCDVDGTLAPIVDDPLDSAVPAETRDVLRALARTYALVACISGRRAADARRLVGVDELAYAGNHGLELLLPGGSEAALDPAVETHADAARNLVLSLDTSALSSAGLRLENKGPIQAVHWRGAADEAAAEEQARAIAAAGEREGLEVHWGRKVLEVRPPAGVDKGTAVRRLIAERPVELALYGGDDRTDLDAFAALRALVEEGRLRGAVCIGIDSPEAPAGLAERADAVVAGPEEFRGVLEALARPKAGADRS
jgi:trehalose 6-phosphate phosphatase